MARSNPVLRRFDMFVYKDKNPPSDKAQVPASGTVHFYLPGATMKDASVFVDEGGGEATLHVYDMGQVAEGDQVMVEGDPTKGLVVGPVDQAAGTVFVTRLGYPGVTVILGNRLILKKVGLTNGRIKVYTDPLGTAPFANDQITLETGTGRARGYVREYKYDYVVTVTGEPAPRAFANAEGSFVMRT